MCCPAVQVDTVELSEHIASSQLKHADDGVLQLQLLASWLARTFSGVSYHLGVSIEKAGLNAGISQPWGDVSEPLQQALLGYALTTSSAVDCRAIGLSVPVAACLFDPMIMSCHQHCHLHTSNEFWQSLSGFKFKLESV
jgi:hypothetical protein